MNNKVLQEIESINDLLIEIRRDFHEHPELGLEEFRTRDKICSYLKEMNINHRVVADTGVLGIIKGKYEGKTVAVRADMDALPIQENNDVAYKSKIEGKMHACGHDAHMAILLGIANVLNRNKEFLKGNIKLLFQPAEETVGGAKRMVDEGVMNHPKVDAVLGLHVSPDIEVGKIGIKYDKMSASSDTLRIDIHGESTHGAYPHSGIDAILIAGHVITALQSIISRNVDPRESGVVSLGVINGGTLGNILADHVRLIGTIRTLDPNVRETIVNNVQRVVKCTCDSFGGKGKVTIGRGYPFLINNDTIVDVVKKSGEELLGKDKVSLITQASLGVEDFGYFLYRAPGAYFKLGCRNEEKGIIHDGHHQLFDIDEGCLQVGVKIMINSILRILEGENENYRYKNRKAIYRIKKTF